jgi:hypothetical protein
VKNTGVDVNPLHRRSEKHLTSPKTPLLLYANFYFRSIPPRASELHELDAESGLLYACVFGD